MIRAVSHSPHLDFDKEDAHGLLVSESVSVQSLDRDETHVDIRLL